MILYPDIYIENLLKIDEEIIKKYEIKAILIDIDNTLVYYDRTIIKGAVDWAHNMKNIGVKLCILSNSNQKDKVEKVAKTLEIPYIYFASKPLKKGYKKAVQILNVKPKNTAMVGDQILTDIVGANRMKMVSILTKPLEEKDIWVTKIKRPLEKYVINRYMKKGEKN